MIGLFRVVLGLSIAAVVLIHQIENGDELPEELTWDDSDVTLEARGDGLGEVRDKLIVHEAEQAVALLENDQGIDPLSKMHIRVVDTAVIHESYDDGLNALLATPGIDIQAMGYDTVDIYRLLGDQAHVEPTLAEDYADQVRKTMETRKDAAILSDQQSVDYYVVFVGRDVAQRDAFLSDHGFDDNRFQSLEKLIDLLHGRQA